MSSPTQRSLADLRKRYPLVAVVEKWNPHARIRQDLFGIIDIVCVGPDGTCGVQSTSGSNVSARIRKMMESPALPLLRDAGWRILVQGWTKGKTGRYTLREVDIS
jgi:hypothetical protein